MLKQLGCTQAQFLTVANNFISCFDGISSALEHDGGYQTTDDISQHRYSLPPGMDKDSDWLVKHDKCACGLVNFKKSERGGVDQGAVGFGLPGGTVVSMLPGGDEITDISSSRSADKPNETKQSSIGNATFGPLSKDEIGGGLILDFYRSKRNALQVAIETASMVLRIKHTIEDTN